LKFSSRPAAALSRKNHLGLIIAELSGMTRNVKLVPKPEGGWGVWLGDTSLAGFYGPTALQMAQSHREVLIAALADVKETGSLQGRRVPGHAILRFCVSD
jgi:hypothetical protein